MNLMKEVLITVLRYEVSPLEKGNKAGEKGGMDRSRRGTEESNSRDRDELRSENRHCSNIQRDQSIAYSPHHMMRRILVMIFILPAGDVMSTAAV